MDVSIGDHAMGRYRERIDRTATFIDILESFLRSEIPDQWVIDMASNAESAEGGDAYMVDGDAIFVVRVWEKSVDVLTVLSKKQLWWRRSQMAILKANGLVAY